jgi:CheY-like chemotaxis protein
MRILLLDDDAFMLELLADMIAELGDHTVLRETDGRRALIELRLRPPELVVCDLSMPVMDGIDFLRPAAAAAISGLRGAAVRRRWRRAQDRRAAGRSPG